MNKLHNLKNIIVILGIIVISVCISYNTYIEYDAHREYEELYSQEAEDFPLVTIDEAMKSFAYEKKYAKDYIQYVNLPEKIVRKIYENLGTNLTMSQIVEEYNKNKKIYVKNYIRDKLYNLPDTTKIR